MGSFESPRAVFRNKGASQWTTKSHNVVFSAPAITEKISSAVMFVNDRCNKLMGSPGQPRKRTIWSKDQTESM
jgi:hypothetical protein